MPLSSQHLLSHNSRPGHYITFALETEALITKGTDSNCKQQVCSIAHRICSGSGGGGYSVTTAKVWGSHGGQFSILSFQFRFSHSPPCYFRHRTYCRLVLVNNADITLNTEIITCFTHFVKYKRYVVKYINEKSGRSSSSIFCKRLLSEPFLE
jgi:hypothetical protein